MGIEGALFDMKRSGAQMSWDYFFPDQERPALINYIGDRDIWSHSLPYTETINLGISSMVKEFEVYDVLANMSIKEFQLLMNSIGEGLLEIKYQVLTRLIDQVKVKTWQDYKIGLIQLNSKDYKRFSSDLGNKIAKELNVDFAVLFTQIEDQYKYSFRSIGEFDVSKIAQIYDGGGHKNASGCTAGELIF